MGPEGRSADAFAEAAASGVNRVTLSGAEFSLTRLSSDRYDLPTGPTLPSSDSYSVIVQLADFVDHRLHRNGKLVHVGGHPTGALAITDMQEAWRCDHRSPFDNVRFSLPKAALKAFVEEEGGRRFEGLANPAGARDEVVFQIAMAMTPALAQPATASQLFIDQMHYALVAHLLHAYGATQERRHLGGLSTWQKTRAMEFMAAHSRRDVSVAEVAAECRLSRGYFIKAFRAATGLTPHRWLVEHRVSEAKALLLTDLPIAEIASVCGFADQSHLTRVFTQVVGMTPGVWRRQCRH
jgi:AraC family transcriptional regulator